MERRRRLVVWLSVLAGLQSLGGASAFADVVGPKVGAFFLAVTSALTVGTAAYVAGMKELESQPVGAESTAHRLY